MTFDPCLLRSHVWLYPRIIVSKSHDNTSMYVDTVINFAKYHIHTTYILQTYYGHTTYRMSDHIVSYWTQFRRDKKSDVAQKQVWLCRWSQDFLFDVLVCFSALKLHLSKSAHPALNTHPNSFWLAMWVPYNTVLLWLLQVGLLLRVLWGYSAATTWVVAPVTVAS